MRHFDDLSVIRLLYPLPSTPSPGNLPYCSSPTKPPSRLRANAHAAPSCPRSTGRMLPSNSSLPLILVCLSSDSKPFKKQSTSSLLHKHPRLDVGSSPALF